jgi:DNA-binding MarR family transcriptional regulator
VATKKPIGNRKSKPVIASNNLRRLLREALNRADDAVGRMAVGSPLEGMRSSEAVVMVWIAEGYRTEAEIARILGISRQAAHKSVQSLRKIGLIATDVQTRDGRSKMLAITDKGHHWLALGAQILLDVEKDLAKKIGKKQLKHFKRLIALVTDGLKQGQTQPSRKRRAGLM